MRLISATQDAEHETWSASFFGALEYLSLNCCIGGVAPGLQGQRKDRSGFFFIGFRFGKIFLRNPSKVAPGKAKRPPGNRVASSLGRIVPTEAKPSELSGEILSLAKYRVKAKTSLL